jgi:hypothetical protein
MGCTNSDLESLYVSYIGDVLLTEYIQKVNSLPACPSNRRMSTDEARIKRTLLTEVQPYLKLKVPAKAELSSSAGWSLIKYPEDIPCSLISKNPNTVQVQSGGKLILAGEGKAVLHAYVTANPDYFTEASIDVYKYRHVQDIDLTVPATVEEGETFKVTTQFTPSNAHNISSAKWEVIPSSSAIMRSNGEFTASKAGKCTVKLTVGNVQAAVDVTVIPKPSGVAFSKNSISLKLGTTQKLEAIPTPAGATYTKIVYTIHDSSVVSYDVKTSTLTPLREGDTEITAELYHHGKCIGKSSGHISVLPVHTIFNPDPPLVFLILGALCMLVLWSSPFKYIGGLTVIACSVWLMIKNFQKDVLKTLQKSEKLIMLKLSQLNG